ncbi:hypothetical protein QBC34DRAFT_161190 [Podospora aff. communis PSN243]|uniref:Uncharacterized protein n=1 Tax=Podospora aff. communis PSN243 TaxID=3040156 RepID=A0AAV9GES7_9PEZI|nr:hypothetical protein QBC34DRAFT_161190 [Podospora aff. communis PSN243]
MATNGPAMTPTLAVTTAQVTSRPTPLVVPPAAPTVPSPVPAANPAPPPALPAPPVAPPVRLDGKAGLPLSKALRDRFSGKTDPIYASSFDGVAFERETRSGLKLTGWRVKGTVQRRWEFLEPSLGSLIRTQKRDWEPQRPKGAVDPAYMLRCFLVGVDQDHATPHAAILCDAAWFCRAIGKMLIKNGLLQAAGFRFLALPDRVELRAGPGDAMDLSGQPTLSIAHLDDFAIRTPTQYHDINGLGIEVLHDDVVIGNATIGGVVKVDGYSLGMTVRHVFRLPSINNSHTPSTGSDIVDWEIDVFEDEDYEVPHDPQTNADGRPEDTFSTTEQQPGVDLILPRREQFQIALNQSLAHDRALAAPDARFDWALRAVRPGDHNRYFEEPQRHLSSKSIVVKSSYQLKYGKLCSSGILGIPETTAPQPVLVAALHGIQPGECGSWAMRRQDGAFTGMLIGSCDSLGEAYLLRMSDILEEIRQQTGCQPTISPIIPAQGRALQTRFGESGELPARGAGALYIDQRLEWDASQGPPRQVQRRLRHGYGSPGSVESGQHAGASTDLPDDRLYIDWDGTGPEALSDRQQRISRVVGRPRDAETSTSQHFPEIDPSVDELEM